MASTPSAASAAHIARPVHSPDAKFQTERARLLHRACAGAVERTKPPLAAGLFDALDACARARPGAEPAAQIRGKPLGMNETRPIETYRHRIIDERGRPQLRDQCFGHVFGPGGERAVFEGCFDLDEKPEILLRSAHRGDDLGQRGHGLAIAWRKARMRPRIKRPGFRPPDIERLKLGESEIADRRQGFPARARQPTPVRTPAESRLQAKIVEDDELFVARQLDVKLGPVIPRLRRRNESKQRVFGP